VIVYVSCDMDLLGMKWNKNGSFVGGALEIIMLEMACGMLCIKEFHGKLLVMVWLVYILIY